MNLVNSYLLVLTNLMWWRGEKYLE